MLCNTLTTLIICLLFSLPVLGNEPFDYTIDIYYGTNFQGPHLVWSSDFGECGRSRATHADLTNTTMSPEYACTEGIHFGAFRVDSVGIPKGVVCTIYSEYVSCICVRLKESKTMLTRLDR